MRVCIWCICTFMHTHTHTNTNTNTNKLSLSPTHTHANQFKVFSFWFSPPPRLQWHNLQPRVFPLLFQWGPWILLPRCQQQELKQKQNESVRKARTNGLSAPRFCRWHLRLATCLAPPCSEYEYRYVDSLITYICIYMYIYVHHIWVLLYVLLRLV